MVPGRAQRVDGETVARRFMLRSIWLTLVYADGRVKAALL
jgi:hypothetical protein